MDLMSGAASAVGIISLGIQVCQGLVSYMRSVEGRTEEIKTGLREVEELVAVFRVLEPLAPKLSAQHLEGSVALQRCLAHSQVKLSELQQLLQELRGPHRSSRMRQRTAEIAKTLIYPFQEGKLASLRKALGELRDNLDIAIGTTTIHEQLALRDDVETIQTSVYSLIDHCAQITDALRDLDQSIADTRHGLERRLARTEKIVEDLGETVVGTLTIMQTDTTTIASNQAMTAQGMEKLVGMMEQQSILLNQFVLRSSNPDALNDHRSDQLTSRSSGQKGFQSCSDQRATEAPICDCPDDNHTSTFSYNFGYLAFKFRQVRPVEHLRGCKLYGISRNVSRQIQAQLPFKIGWFCARVTLAYIDISLGTGSPGLSVQYRNVVPLDRSPVYGELVKTRKKIVSGHVWSLPPGEVMRELERCERTILSFYRDGTAHQRDRTEDDESHAMLFAELIVEIFKVWLDQPHFLATDFSSKAVAMTRTLLSFAHTDDDVLLLDGTEDAFVQGYDATAQRPYYDFLQQMLEVFDNRYTGVPADLDHPHLALPLGFINALDPSPIWQAIMLRSAEDLANAIARDPSSPMEQHQGITTIQACVQWMDGLVLLLGTEAAKLIDDYGTSCWYHPLELAMRAKNAASVEILMRAGCHDNVRLRGWTYHFECVGAYLSNLARRRQELLVLAQRELGLFKDLPPGAAPDAEAAYLCSKLTEASVLVHPSLQVEKGYVGIYHDRRFYLDIFLAASRWGFQSYTTYNDLGLTPIMVKMAQKVFHSYGNTPSHATIEWLAQHGCLDQHPKDLWHIGLSESTVGWHYLGALLCLPWQKVTQEDLQYVWGCSSRDLCRCRCNPQGLGCSPFKAACKLYAVPGRWRDFPSWVEEYAIVSLIEMLQRLNLHDSVSFAIAVEFVHFLTFEALEMDHTCCTLELVNSTDRCFYSRSESQTYDKYEDSFLVFANYDAPKTEGAQPDGQERKDGNLLEVLVSEFTEEMGKEWKTRQLGSFIQHYWKPRISKLYKVGHDSLQAMDCVLSNARTHQLSATLRLFFRKPALWRTEDDSSAHSDIFRNANSIEKEAAFDMFDPENWS